MIHLAFYLNVIAQFTSKGIGVTWKQKTLLEK